LLPQNEFLIQNAPLTSRGEMIEKRGKRLSEFMERDGHFGDGFAE
jgi:hypothetical protein